MEWQKPESVSAFTEVLDGKYTAVRELGRGGMGTVLLARQRFPDRSVALKLLQAGGAGTGEDKLIERFCREAQSLARLDHPGIVRILETGVFEKTPCIAMEYIPGCDLAVILSLLRQNARSGDRLDTDLFSLVTSPGKPHEDGEDSFPAPGGLSRSYVESACQLALQVAEALDHAHRHHVVHRDLKPSNVMVRPDQRVILTDFGLARAMAPFSSALTQTFAGTYLYAAPEQLRKGSSGADPATDVYALGLTLYELFTLQRPFAGRGVAARIDHDPTPLRAHVPSLPRDLETIVLTAIDRVPQNRYASTNDLANDLRRFLDYQTILARPPGWSRRLKSFARRHRELVAGSFAAALLALVFLVWFAVRDHQLLDARRREIEARAETTQASAVAYATLTEQQVAMRRDLALREQQDLRSGGIFSSEELVRWSDLQGQLTAAGTQLESDLKDLLGIETRGDLHSEEVSRAAQGAAYRALLEQAEWSDLKVARWYEQLLDQALADSSAHPRARISLDSSPAGASLRVFEVVESGDELRPDSSPLLQGSLPLAGHALSRGNYLFEITLEGHFPVRLHVLLESREASQEDLNLGTLELPARDELPQDVAEKVVYIPPGNAWIGADPPSRLCGPRRQVFVPGFFCKIHPVTMGEYEEFLDALQEELWESGLGQEAVEAQLRQLYPPTSLLLEHLSTVIRDPHQRFSEKAAAIPILGISLQAAQRYCEWMTDQIAWQVRVPSNSEWEKACRGVDGRLYSWGNRYRPDFAKIQSQRNSPWSVHEPTQDVSIYGVRDLIGNQREWTCTQIRRGKEELWNLVKGAYSREPRLHLASDCESLYELNRDPGTGFRYVIER
jgi:serine/threonine protein kinase/formylglycine-generating enzyme required for sulfatase activity